MAPQAIRDPRETTDDAQTAARRGWLRLSAFQRDLLSTVAAFDGAPNGREIKHVLSAAMGEECGHPRVYTNLDTLADADLVDKSAGEYQNAYALTTWGERVLQAGADRLAEATGAGE
jgi:Fe2+ or Zn2+ uptake regulation protein